MASHYQTLGLQPDAEAKAIKRAYFRGVRKHPPEKDPDGFRRIREAYETLSDSAARASYDALQAHGDQIDDDIQKGMAFFEEEDWVEASRCFKRVLLLDSNAHAARNLLALSLARDGDREAAIKALESLTGRAPEVPLYFINLGQLLDEAAAAVGDGDAAEARVLTERARSAFGKAIELERHNCDPYLAIAETYLRERDFAQALSFAEQAVAARGQVDYQDFEALFFMCRVRLHEGELEKVGALARRIDALVPDDDEVRKYVAMRFAFFAHLLVGVEAFRPAGVFLRAAKQFDESNEELAGFGLAIDEIIGLSEDAEAIDDDDEVLPPIRAMVPLLLAARLGSPDVDAEAIWGQVIELLPHLPQDELHGSAQRLKRKCPTFYAAQTELVDMMIDSTRKAARACTACRRAVDDESLDPSVRMFCAFLLDVARGYYVGKDAEADVDLRKVVQVFDSVPAGPARQSLRTVRIRYAEVRVVAPDLFDEIETALRRASEAPVRYQSSRSKESCVAKGSLVLMADGRERPIEQVLVGDLVRAYDRRSGRLVAGRVRRVSQHAPQPVVGLQIGGRSLRATRGHRLVHASALPRVESVLAGRGVLTVDAHGAPETVGVTSVGDAGIAAVYNLEVAGLCTYVADGVIVHSFVVLPVLREWCERLRFRLVLLLGGGGRRRRVFGRAGPGPKLVR